MGERCWRCATPLAWHRGIGAHCANPRCDVVDALDPAGGWEIRIVLEPAPQTRPDETPMLRRRQADYAACR
jgi:hypothetical protein